MVREVVGMTARKALELTAIFLLPGVLLYGAFAFVSLEVSPAQWTEGWRALFAYLSLSLGALAVGLRQIENTP